LFATHHPLLKTSKYSWCVWLQKYRGGHKLQLAVMRHCDAAVTGASWAQPKNTGKNASPTPCPNFTNGPNAAASIALTLIRQCMVTSCKKQRWIPANNLNTAKSDKIRYNSLAPASDGQVHNIWGLDSLRKHTRFDTFYCGPLLDFGVF